MHQNTKTNDPPQACDRIAIYQNAAGTVTGLKPVRKGEEAPGLISVAGEARMFVGYEPVIDLQDDAAVLEAVRLAEAAGELDEFLDGAA